MTDKQLKATVEKWAQKIGREEAIARLILTKNVAVSTAERLCDGLYKSTPRGRVKTAVLSELAKDGFKLTRDKAS